METVRDIIATISYFIGTIGWSLIITKAIKDRKNKTNDQLAMIGKIRK